MLTKRTQILFDQELWQKLNQLAESRNTSIGELVRLAVKKHYTNDALLERRERAIEATLKGRFTSKGKIDYKELINYGRKY